MLTIKRILDPCAYDETDPRAIEHKIENDQRRADDAEHFDRDTLGNRQIQG